MWLRMFAKFLIASSTVFIIRLIAIKDHFHLPVADTALPVDDYSTMQH